MGRKMDIEDQVKYEIVTSLYNELRDFFYDRIHSSLKMFFWDVIFNFLDEQFNNDDTVEDEIYEEIRERDKWK